MTTVRCPIWNTEAEELAKHYDDLKVDSPRAGGIYRISGTAAGTVKAKTPAERARLTTWIVDQRRSGVEAPHVTDDVIREAVSRRPLSTSARLQRFFLLALARDLQPTGTFKVAGIVDEKYLDDAGAIAAWTECRANEEVADLLRLLQEEGLVTDGQVKKLTAKGFERMEALESGAARTTQAFVAMWFDSSMTDAFDKGFQQAIVDAGYRAFRVDRKEHGNKIDDEIIAEIRRSRFVVADFTCGVVDVADKPVAMARGGVYYEAGFAQGLRIPVIWSCRENCLEHVHFDTRQFNHIVWTDPADLRVKLLNRIRAVIV
jgi:hypothetical protein